MNINLSRKVQDLKNLCQYEGFTGPTPMRMNIDILEMILLEIQSLEKKPYKGQKGNYKEHK